MARKKREQLEFGSDSFLDIVANIVGILIILIVVVGVRVANAPTASNSPQKIAEEVEDSPQPAPPRELPPLPSFAPLPEIKPSEEMIQHAAALRKENERLKAQLQQLSAEQARLDEQRKTHDVQTALLRKQVSEQIESLQQDQSQMSTLQANVVGLETEIAALRQRLAESSPTDAPVEKLTHRLPPIGRVVTGEEIHFRLYRNRISCVPIDDLAKEVQRDIERRKEILISRPFYQGSTRPVKGYLMEYVLQRQSMTLAEQMRAAPGMIRIGVSGWVIKPVGPIREETAEEALRPDSSFQSILRQAGPTATVTFWVYPDSFEIHRKLMDLLHDANFWVASRPLPQGVPIAGSPNGSKSVAQ